MENCSGSLRREIDIMLASAVLEVPEHEFDDEDWDDAEELESDEIEVELGEEDVELEDDEDF